jgi:dTDP-4-amino-4,6-dideoxygalactose transaminase
MGRAPRHKVAELERGFARAIETRHALAVTSGTAALIVGLAALGIGPGDEVIVPTYTWVATVNAEVSLGALPVFVDIDASLTMDPAAIEAAITQSQTSPDQLALAAPERTRSDVRREARWWWLAGVPNASGTG